MGFLTQREKVRGGRSCGQTGAADPSPDTQPTASDYHLWVCFPTASYLDLRQTLLTVSIETKTKKKEGAD